MIPQLDRLDWRVTKASGFTDGSALVLLSLTINFTHALTDHLVLPPSMLSDCYCRVVWARFSLDAQDPAGPGQIHLADRSEVRQYRIVKYEVGH